MGTYSIRGSERFDALVDQQMQRIADEAWTSSYSKHWKALVLTGGYGRGEGGMIVDKDGRETPFGDYQLAVVTTRNDALVRGALAHLEKRLTAELGLQVHLTPYLKSALSSCEFSLRNYELKYAHRVIRGPADILKRMPAYPHDLIPLTEGTRLLMNCGKLLLDIKTRLAGDKKLSEEERIRFTGYLLKTDRAFGDCVLLMRNEYDLSCAVREERIKTADFKGLDNPRGLTNAYLSTLSFMKTGNFRPYQTANIPLWLNEAEQRFLQVFLWYERRTLNRKFRSLKKYAKTFPELGNEGSRLKNAWINLRTFGLYALPALTIHPRIRLYPAIALLLDEVFDAPSIQRLLCSRNIAFPELCDDFRRLHSRFG